MSREIQDSMASWEACLGQGRAAGPDAREAACEAVRRGVADVSPTVDQNADRDVPLASHPSAREAARQAGASARARLDAHARLVAAGVDSGAASGLREELADFVELARASGKVGRNGSLDASVLSGKAYDRGHQGASVSAGDLVGRATDRLLRSSSAWSLTARAMRIWRAMPDERVRSHVSGVSLTQRRVSRVLTFYADSSVWVQELSLRRYELLQEWGVLCERLDPELSVDELAFKLSKRARADGHDGSLANYGVQPVRVRARLTEQESAGVAERVAPIADLRLRKSVQDAMTAVLEWKKSNGR